MMNPKQNMSIEQGVEEILAILEGAPTKEVIVAETKTEKKEPIETVGPSMTYDGRGHVVEINGKTTVTGSRKKGGKRIPTAKDRARADLLDDIEVVLHRTEAFKDSIGRNKQEGLVIRMEDADYTIKVGGHTTVEYAPSEKGFKPEISYATRGKVVNHSSAIAKLLVSKIENENLGINWDLNGEQVSKVFVCAVKASGIRIQIQKKGADAVEYTIKITKKGARIVMS